MQVPVEIYYLTSKYLPSYILANYSSTTFSLFKIFGKKIEYLNFNSNLNYISFRSKELIKNFNLYKKIYKILQIKQMKI